jgi:hypothetical protein
MKVLIDPSRALNANQSKAEFDITPWYAIMGT